MNSSSQQKGNSVLVSKGSQVICPIDNLIILTNYFQHFCLQSIFPLFPIFPQGLSSFLFRSPK